MHINEHKNIFFYIMKNYTNFNIHDLCIEDTHPPPPAVWSLLSPQSLLKPEMLLGVSSYIYKERKAGPKEEVEEGGGQDSGLRQ